MDRQIVYPGAIPLETDLLNTNKYAMIGIAKLASAILGSNTYVHGLACTPSSPASMTVNVAPGQIYSLQNIDGTAYSSLPADTTHSILKQGISLDTTAFALTAPGTSGYSVNYLIQATFSETDKNATVLPYYNASNPSVAWSGPNNTGTAQNTLRSGVCTLSLKAGVPATTGTQTTPAPDTGYIALYVITVSQGATTVTASNITVAPNAPIIPASGIFSAIQQGSVTFATDTGTANSYVASYLPNLPAQVDGMRLTFKAKNANTGASTLSVNGGAASPLYSHANQTLQGGEIVANGLVEVEWNSSLTAWVMCGNSGGSLPVLSGTQSNHAINLGQVPGLVLASVGAFGLGIRNEKLPGTMAAVDVSRFDYFAPKDNIGPLPGQWVGGITHAMGDQIGWQIAGLGQGAVGGSPRAFIRMMLSNGNFSNWGELYHTLNKPSASDVGALPVNGTADSATKLSTPRNIAGVAFDGTGDINLTPANVGAVSASGGDYNQTYRLGAVGTLGNESNPVQLISAAAGQATDSFVAWTSYTWYKDYVRTGVVRAGDNTVKSFAVEINGVRFLEIGRDGTFLNGNMASDLRLGQQESMNVTIPGTGQSTDSVVPSGCYVTGLTSTSTGNYVGITKIFYRRLQRKVGGNWVDATWL